jgi:uncharacterized coiled-coil protein SlyX
MTLPILLLSLAALCGLGAVANAVYTVFVRRDYASTQVTGALESAGRSFTEVQSSNPAATEAKAAALEARLADQKARLADLADLKARLAALETRTAARDYVPYMLDMAEEWRHDIGFSQEERAEILKAAFGSLRVLEGVIDTESAIVTIHFEAERDGPGEAASEQPGSPALDAPDAPAELERRAE